MSGVKGNPRTLFELNRRIRKIPVVLAQEVAADVAPVLTSMAQSSYGGGQTVYGEARPSGVAGNALDLEVTGATRGDVRFVAIGTVVRAVLGTRWAKYLVGKYRILPMGAIPVAWSKRIAELARARIGRALA